MWDFKDGDYSGEDFNGGRKLMVGGCFWGGVGLVEGWN